MHPALKQLFPLLILILTLTSGCLPEAPVSSPWTYADLRQVNPPGLQGEPALTAIYLREAGRELQIRLDFLEIGVEIDYDLYLAVDTLPGGTRRLPLQAEADLDWELLISLPAQGQIQAEKTDGAPFSGLRLRLERDPFLDTVVVHLDRAALGGSRVEVQAFLAASRSARPASSIGPVRGDRFSALPPGRASVLLAFWNTFPAATPAQALRRWDGAHSGPDSARHGLRRLLDAVESTGTPVVLLDLNSPQAFSALDYTGGLPRLRRLAQMGLLTLPQPAAPYSIPVAARPGGLPFGLPAWALEQFSREAGQASLAFELPAGPFLYAPEEQLLAGLRANRTTLIFIGAIPPGEGEANAADGSRTQLSRLGSRTVLPLPVGWDERAAVSGTPWQAGPEGPSLEVRRLLAEAAAQASDPGRAAALELVVLGGSLPDSTWGDPQAALNTLRYLAARPWIEVVSGEDLLRAAAQLKQSDRTASPGTAEAPPDPESDSDLAALQQQIFDELRQAPSGVPADLAWQMVFSLLAPAAPHPPALPALRAGYLGQVGKLLEAARWAADPAAYGEVSACEQDLDWDGQPECILASARLFAVFEQQGGYLSTAFTAQGQSVNQVVAPSSQFVVGLGDPSSWDPSRGAAGDPGQLRGAFSDIPAGFTSPSWDTYAVESLTGGLIFTAQDGRISKTFTIDGNRLRAEYRSLGALRVQIPLALDAQTRFSPAWFKAYDEKTTPEGWEWSRAGGARVRIRSSEAFSTQVFNTGQSEALQPEDPNYNYPPGHFLPFPLALAEITGEGEFWIELDFDSHTARDGD